MTSHLPMHYASHMRVFAFGINIASPHTRLATDLEILHKCKWHAAPSFLLQGAFPAKSGSDNASLPVVGHSSCGRLHINSTFDLKVQLHLHFFTLRWICSGCMTKSICITRRCFASALPRQVFAAKMTITRAGVEEGLPTSLTLGL